MIAADPPRPPPPSSYSPKLLRARLPQECSSKSEWTTAITRHLNSAVPDSYELLSTVSLWEIHLVVFVRSRIHCKFLHVRTDTEATGIGHVLGNKGGAGISFEFEQTRFCIVSSHLAAHTEGFNTRNKNYMEICENLKGLSSSQGQGREFLHRCVPNVSIRV